MPTDELLTHLKSLEVHLHQTDAWNDPSGISAILHARFVEFGSSGATYTRAQIIESLGGPSAGPAVRIWSQDYRLHLQESGLALLLYHSAHIGYDDRLVRHTLRSSLWQNTADGWQMLFHQGTPTLPFAAAQHNESAGTPPAP
jgi:hypothetical protein